MSVNAKKTIALYSYRREEKMYVQVTPIGESDYTNRTHKIRDTEFNTPPVRTIEGLERKKFYYLVGEISPFGNESPIVFLFCGIENKTSIPRISFTVFADNKKEGTEPFSFSRKVGVADRDNIGIFPSADPKCLASDHWTHALLPLEATSPKEAIAEAKKIAREMNIQLH